MKLNQFENTEKMLSLLDDDSELVALLGHLGIWRKSSFEGIKRDIENIVNYFYDPDWGRDKSPEKVVFSIWRTDRRQEELICDLDEWSNHLDKFEVPSGISSVSLELRVFDSADVKAAKKKKQPLDIYHGHTLITIEFDKFKDNKWIIGED